MVLAEVLADGREGVADGVVGEVLREVGEDEVVGGAFEEGDEVGGEFFVDFGGAGFEEDEDARGAGDGAAAFGVGFDEVEVVTGGLCGRCGVVFCLVLLRG